MTDDGMVRSLQEQLFSDATMNLFAVLDGASVPGLRQVLHEQEPEYWCLFPGDLEPDMAEVAPYLVGLSPESGFTHWLLSNGWGNHWGIFVVTSAEIRDMRAHFRSLVKVYDADGKAMYFRFYDPRVLRRFLPTCHAGELAELFGPTSWFAAEGEDEATMLRFRLGDLGLETETVKVQVGRAGSRPR